MKLRDVQQSFQNDILTKADDMIEFIEKPKEGLANDRIAIYSDGYILRLKEVLADDYPHLKNLVGDDEFDKLIDAYIAQNTSTQFSINDYGKNLSNFMQHHPLSTRQPWLVELAQFEWFQGQAIIAADAELLTGNDLSKMPQQDWPNLRFHLHPSLAMTLLHWNILNIIEALDENTKPPQPSLLPEPVSVIIWRKSIDIRYSELHAIEALMIHAIKQACTFAEICQQLCEHVAEEHAASCAADLLAIWLQAEVLVK